MEAAIDAAYDAAYEDYLLQLEAYELQKEKWFRWSRLQNAVSSNVYACKT